MSVWLILALAGLTYLSRVAGLAFLPTPSERFELVLNRIPAPLFASFAAVSLVTASRDLAPAETLAAVAGALVAARTRSLLVVLVAGLAGYGAALAIAAIASS